MLFLCPLFFPGFLTAAHHGSTGQGAHHRRKGELKAYVTDGVAVARRHQNTGHTQRGQGIRRAVDPDPQRTEPDGPRRAQNRGRKARHAHQQQCQHRTEQRPDPAAGIAAQALFAAGQQPAQHIAAQDRNVHSADHQHMGKPRAPVGRAQLLGEMGAVARNHGGQHARRAGGHPLPQGGAQPLLEPGRPGAEGGALPQQRKAFLISSVQGNAIGQGIQAGDVIGCFQRKAALDPVAGAAGGQAGALHPEGGRLPVHHFHLQDRPHPAGGIGRGDTLHLCLQQDTAAIVGGLDRIPFCLRGTGQHKAQRSPQDQADAIAPGRTFAQTARQRPQQTGNKKCRKRHKTSRLRQKGAHQLQPQRSCAENTERAAHLT